ncbi:MAG: heat shock protein HspQ [Thiotrichales bacterium]
MNASAKFNLGQVVHHRQTGNRGVVVDVDPQFQGRREWLEAQDKEIVDRDDPWYYVLVDGHDAAAYVAEIELQADFAPLPIKHPHLASYFEAFDGGSYRTRRSLN